MDPIQILAPFHKFQQNSNVNCFGAFTSWFLMRFFCVDNSGSNVWPNLEQTLNIDVAVDLLSLHRIPNPPLTV